MGEGGLLDSVFQKHPGRHARKGVLQLPGSEVTQAVGQPPQGSWGSGAPTFFLRVQLIPDLDPEVRSTGMWPRMRLFRAFSRTCFVNGPTQCFPLSLPTGSGMQPSALGWLRLSVHWLIRSHGGADAVRSASTVGKPLLKPGAAEPLGVGQRVRGPAVETCRRPLGKREAESAGSRVGRWQLLLGPFLSTKGQTVRPLSIEPRSRGVQLRADVPLFTHRPSHMHFISPKFPAVLRTEFVTKLTPSLKFLFREQKCHSFFLSSGILSDFHRATTEGGVRRFR